MGYKGKMGQWVHSAVFALWNVGWKRSLWQRDGTWFQWARIAYFYQKVQVSVFLITGIWCVKIDNLLCLVYKVIQLSFGESC